MNITEEILVPQSMSLTAVKVGITTAEAGLIVDGEPLMHILPGGFTRAATIRLFASDLGRILGWMELSDAAYSRTGSADREEQQHLLSTNRIGIRDALEGASVPVTLHKELLTYQQPRIVDGMELTTYEVISPKADLRLTQVEFTPFKVAAQTPEQRAIAAATSEVAVAKADLHGQIVRLQAATELAELKAILDSLQPKVNAKPGKKAPTKAGIAKSKRTAAKAKATKLANKLAKATAAKITADIESNRKIYS